MLQKRVNDPPQQQVIRAFRIKLTYPSEQDPEPFWILAEHPLWRPRIVSARHKVLDIGVEHPGNTSQLVGPQLVVFASLNLGEIPLVDFGPRRQLLLCQPPLETQPPDTPSYDPPAIHDSLPLVPLHCSSPLCQNVFWYTYIIAYSRSMYTSNRTSAVNFPQKPSLGIDIWH